MADGFGDDLRPRIDSPEASPSATRLCDLLSAQSAVAAERELPAMLRRVVLAARELAGARDAMLGVLGDDGGFADFVHTGLDPGAAERAGRPPEGRGVLQMPIQLRDKPFGTLYLTGSTNGGFSAVDERLVAALACAATVAIDNAGLRAESARAGHWACAAAEVVRRSLADGGAHLPDLVVRFARDTADADFATVAFLVEPARLEVGAAIGPMTGDLVGVRMGMRANLAGQVARTGIPVRPTGPTETAATVLPIRTGPAVIVPLMAGGTVRGTLNVGRIRGAPAFTDADLAHLAGFAGQVGVAMELAARPGPGHARLAAGDDLHARLLELADVHAPVLGHPVGIRFTRRRDRPLPPVLADDMVTVVRDTMTGLARDGGPRHVELHVDIAADLVLVEVVSDGGNHLSWTARTTDGAR
jgi:two-component system, NarL family, sensor histidine kinase DevS